MRRLAAGIALICAAIWGCASGAARPATLCSALTCPPPSAAFGAGLPNPPETQPVSSTSLQIEPLPAEPTSDVLDPARGESREPSPTELHLDQLIQEVLAVNPSLEAAMEAWRAAAFRYPQMIALDDPMFRFISGTGVGWMVEASQKLPWPGKRSLRGNLAAAEANALQWEAEDVRRMLAEATAIAFFDYYQADRQLAVVAENAELIRQFGEIAKAKYESGQVSEQDVLQARVELAELKARQAELQRERKIAAARINTLLHRAIDHPLPPPPAKLEVSGVPADSAALVELALKARPDLAAQMARIRAEEYALRLACKDYYPDPEIVFKYDAFMPVEMRTQVGVNVNVPLC